jgi:hypothetical protein
MSRTPEQQKRIDGIRELRYVYGMKIREIAEAIGVTHQYVQQVAPGRIQKIKPVTKATAAEKFVERFWKNIDIRGSDDCWEWQGLKYPTGYGRVRFNGKMRYAHRVMYQIKSGEEIPAGMEVMHTCDNPGCVSPEHLVLGTHADNMRDRDKKGRHRGPQIVRELCQKRDKELAGYIAKTYQGQPVTIAQLAEDTGVCVSTMYVKVRRLEQRKLIRYERDPRGSRNPGLVYARPA